MQTEIDEEEIATAMIDMLNSEMIRRAEKILSFDLMEKEILRLCRIINEKFAESCSRKIKIQRACDLLKGQDSDAESLDRAVDILESVLSDFF